MADPAILSRKCFSLNSRCLYGELDRLAGSSALNEGGGNYGSSSARFGAKRRDFPAQLPTTVGNRAEFCQIVVLVLRHAEETRSCARKLGEKYKVNKIIIEANFGDGMYAKLLQPHPGDESRCDTNDADCGRGRSVARRTG